MFLQRLTRQNGLMPLGDDIVAVTATSVAKKMIDMNIHRSSTPNRGLVLISATNV